MTVLRRILCALIRRDSRARKGLPALTGERQRIREQIAEAERECRCRRVGELRRQMRETLHEELRAGLRDAHPGRR